MEEKHGSVIKILENRLKMIWCSSCDQQKRADRLCQHLKVVNIQNAGQADNFENLSKPVKESPNIREQDSQTNTETSSNLKEFHGRNSLQYKSQDRMLSINLSNLQNDNQSAGNNSLFQSPLQFKPPYSSNNDTAHVQEIEHLKQENELLKASLLASTRSQSADSKFTDSSLGSAASADGLALRRQHKDEVDALNKTIGELEDKLKRTKDKYKAQFEEQKERMNKLEKKLEAKDSELIQFRSQVSGLEVQCLKIELTEVTVRLEERNKQLMEVKEQLKEWTDTANKLINNKADFDEWKKKFQQMSVPNSTVPSPDQSLECSQDDSASPQVQTDNEEEQTQISANSKAWRQQHNRMSSQMHLQSETYFNGKDIDRQVDGINIQQEHQQESARTKCPYCSLITSKTLEQHWKECDLKIRLNYIVCSYGKQWKQILTEDQFIHISEHSQFKRMFSEFCNDLSGVELNEVQQLQQDILKANDIDPTIVHSEYYCSLCSSDFNSFGSRFQHYQNCVGLKRHYEAIKQQMQFHKNKAEQEEQKKMQTVIDFSGNILKGVVDSVNLVKQLTPTDKKAKEIYGDDYKQLLQLHKELHQKDYFKGG